MRLSDVQTNLEVTRSDMREQIGVDVGGPTGACNLVVLGGLTGARLDFHNIPSTPGEMAALEEQHGLYRARVYAPGVLTIDAMRILFEQERLSFNGIIAQGRIHLPDRRPQPHAVAAVVDERRQPFCVIDSLAEGGLLLTSGTKQEKITDARAYVQGRFLPDKPSFSLALDEEQKRQFRGGSLIELAGRVSVGLDPPARRR